MAEDTRSGLRRRLRAARRALGAPERERAAFAVAERLRRMGLPRPGSRIAAYRPMDGEIDPAPVLARARALGCAIYLPAITDFRRRRMRFLPEAGGPAPAADPARWLDLVLVPLVGFDERGNRLGMGAAFYDRHFAFLRHRLAWRRPRLLGLAFELQRVPRLQALPHDVPLWGTVTERGAYGPAAARLARSRAPAGR